MAVRDIEDCDCAVTEAARPRAKRTVDFIACEVELW